MYFANCTTVFLPKFWSCIWWVNNLIEIGNIIIFVTSCVAFIFFQSEFESQSQLLWCILAIFFCCYNQRGIAVVSWIRNFIWNYKIEIYSYRMFNKSFNSRIYLYLNCLNIPAPTKDACLQSENMIDSINVIYE